MLKTACGNGFPLNIPSVIPESGGSGGTSDYSDLTNKPQINDVTLSGNKSLSDIGAASAADVSDIQDLIPSDASTTNKLATADDIPGVATISAPGIVQPDGTSITISNGVISAVGGSGGLAFNITETIIGTWKGNPLYALIVEGTTGTASTADDTISTGLSDVTALSITGVAYGSTDVIQLPTSTSGQDYLLLRFRPSTGQIIIRRNTFTSLPVSIILLYTKNSD